MRHGQPWCPGECCNGELPADSRFEAIECTHCKGGDCERCDWQGYTLAYKLVAVMQFEVKSLIERLAAESGMSTDRIIRELATATVDYAYLSGRIDPEPLKWMGKT